ncbi:MAG: NosD domain-containing protein [Methanobacterium sp.]
MKYLKIKKQATFLALIALLIILLGSAVSAADTHNNATNNRTNYTSEDIQLVIDDNDTTDNDTVLIKQGNYTTPLNLNKSLTLQWDGNGTRPVVPSIYIDSSGSGSRLIGLHIKNILNSTGAGISLVDASNVVIEDCIIEGFADNTGIFLLNASDNTVQVNEIINNSDGIVLLDSSNNNISGNNVTNSTEYGIIVLWGSSNNTLDSNDVSNNQEGIMLGGAPDNILTNNTINNNTRNFGVYGWGDLINYRQVIDLSNTINGNPIFYLMDLVSGIYNGTAMGFLGAVNCTNLIFTNLNITNNQQGVLLAGSNNITIENSNFSHHMDGIFLDQSYDNKIIENIIKDTIDNGIVLWNSMFNTINKNNLTENKDDGITFYDSSNNTVSENIVTDNTGNGIIIGGSNNIISRNTVLNNGHGESWFGLGFSGIALVPDEFPSNNNTISENNIAGSLYGIWLLDSTNSNISRNNITDNFYGIGLERSTNNTITVNSITNNMRGIYLVGPHTGNSIHFNRIITASGKFAIKNDDPGLVNASYNWYGRNENVTALISGNVTFDPWLILSINATPDSIYAGNNSAVTADLRYDSNGTLHNVTYLMDGIPVAFSSILGTVYPVSGNTTNSTANTTFTAGHTPGTANVSAAVDTQTVSTSIQIAGLPTAAASPPGGNYYTNVTVNLTSTGGLDPVKIFYTTDGSTPTNTSTQYTAPLFFNTTTTLKFFAKDKQGTSSPVYNETYNIAALPTATASLPGGNYYNNVTVNLASSGGFSPVKIFFTTNGTTPTNTSTQYTAPLTLNTTTTLKFIAQDNKGTYSPVRTETYQIAALPTATASLPGGDYYHPVTVALTSQGGFIPVKIFFTTNGTTPTNTSTQYTAPLTLNTTTTLKFFVQDKLGANSTVHTETYSIYRQVAYTYSVSVPVMRWVKRRVRVSGRWRSRWVSVPATFRVKRWFRSGGKWKFMWVRVPKTTTEHRTGYRWEKT